MNSVLNQPPYFSKADPVQDYIRGYAGTLSIKAKSDAQVEKRCEELGYIPTNVSTLDDINRKLDAFNDAKTKTADMVDFLSTVDANYAAGMHKQGFSDKDVAKTIAAFHATTKFNLISEYVIAGFTEPFSWLAGNQIGPHGFYRPL